MACERKLKVGIMGGTGLDQDSDILTSKREVSLEATPYGSASDATAIEGQIEGIEVVILGRHGKKHDINPSNVNYRANLWTLKELGCTHLLVTTACGSLREELAPGDFAVLDQYIDRTSGRRANTFYTVSHIPQGRPFDQRMQAILTSACTDMGFKVHTKATAITIEGPRFSTLAESLLHRSWGGHVVNMTTVPEAQLAAELGLIYGSLALVTDYDCWRESEDEHVSVELVTKRLQDLGAKAKQVLVKAVQEIGKIDWDQIVEEKEKMAKGAIMCL